MAQSTATFEQFGITQQQLDRIKAQGIDLGCYLKCAADLASCLEKNGPTSVACYIAAISCAAQCLGGAAKPATAGARK